MKSPVEGCHDYTVVEGSVLIPAAEVQGTLNHFLVQPIEVLVVAGVLHNEEIVFQDMTDDGLQATALATAASRSHHGWL